MFLANSVVFAIIVGRVTMEIIWAMGVSSSDNEARITKAINYSSLSSVSSLTKMLPIGVIFVFQMVSSLIS